MTSNESQHTLTLQSRQQQEVIEGRQKCDRGALLALGGAGGAAAGVLFVVVFPPLGAPLLLGGLFAIGVGLARFVAGAIRVRAGGTRPGGWLGRHVNGLLDRIGW